eukprot:GHVL01021253.1.p1 GENE.GHVL01021253.1~~GHVL01021253.1.p1  ORF type:complete len:135 (+),score=24.91 GHVL01021253.1:1135-1539(+)
MIMERVRFALHEDGLEKEITCPSSSSALDINFETTTSETLTHGWEIPVPCTVSQFWLTNDESEIESARTKDTAFERFNGEAALSQDAAWDPLELSGIDELQREPLMGSTSSFLTHFGVEDYWSYTNIYPNVFVH